MFPSSSFLLMKEWTLHVSLATKNKYFLIFLALICISKFFVLEFIIFGKMHSFYSLCLENMKWTKNFNEINFKFKCKDPWEMGKFTTDFSLSQILLNSTSTQIYRNLQELFVLNLNQLVQQQDAETINKDFHKVIKKNSWW